MSNPTILMLDEPSLGLSPILCSELFRALAEICRAGTAILLVEQNAKQSLAIADRGYLLETGRITGEDTAEALEKDQTVMRAYLGGATRIIDSLEQFDLQWLTQTSNSEAPPYQGGNEGNAVNG